MIAAMIEILFLVFFFVFFIPFACDQKPVCFTVDNDKRCVWLDKDGLKIETSLKVVPNDGNKEK